MSTNLQVAMAQAKYDVDEEKCRGDNPRVRIFLADAIFDPVSSYALAATNRGLD
jgi:hypothetical protein